MGNEIEMFRYCWRHGVLTWGAPLAMAAMILLTVMAAVSGDWSTVNLTLLIQVLAFFLVLGFFIGLFRFSRFKRREKERGVFNTNDRPD